jgi:hypothetical protein
MPAEVRSAQPARQLTKLPGPREGLWLGLVLALLACLPVLVCAYPQMGDYPAHLARYHVMLADGQNPWLNRYYGFEWKWTGNLGVDLLIGPLARLIGFETAGRLISGLIPVLTGLAMLTVEWTLRKRIGVGSLLGFAFIWSPSLLLGFLNFALSVALALFAFALWVRLAGWRWRWAVFIPMGLVVWLCHVSGWGVLGLLVFGYEWQRSKNWRAFFAPWPLTAPILPMLFGAGTTGLFSYGAHVQLYKLAIWLKAMRDQSMQLDILGLALVVTVLLIALGRKRIDGRLGWAALLLLIGSLAMPRQIVGGDYADYRLISTGLMVACLAIDWQLPRWVLYLAPALFLGRLAATTEGWLAGSRETAQLLGALDHVPQGARIASAVASDQSLWRFNTFEHIGSYAVVRRDALVNSNFAIPRVHMLTMRDGGRNFIDASQRIKFRPGDTIDLGNYQPALQADYLWYVGHPEPSRLPPGAIVIWRSDHGLLARLAKAGDPS